MVKHEVLNIPLKQLARAAKDPCFREALALAVILKANYGSSVLMQFSLRKLQSLIKTNFYTLQRAVDNALKFRLLKKDTYVTRNGVGRTDIIATKFSGNGKCVKLKVAGDLNNKRLFLNNDKGKPQTLKEVCELLLMSSVTVAVKSYEKKYDAEKWQGKEKIQKKLLHYGVQNFDMDETPKVLSKENRHNTGYSYERMGDIFDGTLTRYKVMDIVKKCKEDGLFTSKRHDMSVMLYDPNARPVTVNPEKKGIRAAFEAGVRATAIMTRREAEQTYAYDKMSKVVNISKRGYIGTLKDDDELCDVWMMRMANSYHLSCDIIGYRGSNRRRTPNKRIKDYNRDHLR